MLSVRTGMIWFFVYLSCKVDTTEVVQLVLGGVWEKGDGEEGYSISVLVPNSHRSLNIIMSVSDQFKVCNPHHYAQKSAVRSVRKRHAWLLMTTKLKIAGDS